MSPDALELAASLLARVSHPAHGQRILAAIGGALVSAGVEGDCGPAAQLLADEKSRLAAEQARLAAVEVWTPPEPDEAEDDLRPDG